MKVWVIAWIKKGQTGFHWYLKRSDAEKARGLSESNLRDLKGEGL